jgi:adenylyl- and sulfurtransferase ThiI
LKRATVLRWTGRGSIAHLEGSVEQVLKVHGGRGRVTTIGDSVVVRGSEPLGVAALVRFMPGISWIAAGFAAQSWGDMAKAGGTLAKSYLRRGERFSVEAEGTRSTSVSDVGGMVTSRILETVKGARVSESPRVRFRVAADGRVGVVGVEVSAGVGGVPTGTEEATCFVSGGVHSSVCAWMASLAGYRVRMVHAKESEQSVLAVARLYSTRVG